MFSSFTLGATPPSMDPCTVIDTFFSHCVGKHGDGFGIALRRMAMRSFWETEMMVMKPRTVRMKTTRALATSQSLTSPSRAYCKQGRWVSLTKGEKLMAIHPSGEIITEGPIAPASSNLVIVSSTEVCDHLNGVAHCGRGKRRIVPTRGRGA